jgi:hypothetical protein
MGRIHRLPIHLRAGRQGERGPEGVEYAGRGLRCREVVITRLEQQRGACTRLPQLRAVDMGRCKDELSSIAQRQDRSRRIVILDIMLQQSTVCMPIKRAFRCWPSEHIQDIRCHGYIQERYSKE